MDIRNSTVMVTGATSGIGRCTSCPIIDFEKAECDYKALLDVYNTCREVAKTLAGKGAHVVLAVRDLRGGAMAAEAIR